MFSATPHSQQFKNTLSTASQVFLLYFIILSLIDFSLLAFIFFIFLFATNMTTHKERKDGNVLEEELAGVGTSAGQRDFVPIGKKLHSNVLSANTG